MDLDIGQVVPGTEQSASLFVDLFHGVPASRVGELDHLLFDGAEARLAPARDRVGQVVVLQGELGDEVGRERLGEDPQTFFFVEVRQLLQRIPVRILGAAVLVEGPVRQRARSR